MKLELHFAAACGLGAFLALSAPVSAATIDYDLVGDTTTAYTSVFDPHYQFIDLQDANTGSDVLPSRTLSTGDTVHLTVTFNHPVTTDSFYDIYLQDTASPDSWVNIAPTPTFSYFNGGTSVPFPSSSGFSYTSGTGGGFGTGEGFVTNGSETITFDKVIIDLVIESLTDTAGNPTSSVTLLESYPYFDIYTFNTPVSQTPIPSTLLLMSTALGGLGIFTRRKRGSTGAA